MRPKPKPTKAPRASKKRPKSERRKLEHQLDTLTSLIVRWRDGVCVLCGSSERLQNSHLIKRGKRPSRWSLRNCNANCASHNFRHNNFPEEYTLWFIRKYGEQEYRDLCAEAFSDRKYTVPELDELLERYRDLWENRPPVYDEEMLRDLGYFGDPVPHTPTEAREAIEL